MNPVLLLVFLLAPVACHIILRESEADEAQEIAQSILDILKKAYATKNRRLLTTVFYPYFTAKYCIHGCKNIRDLEYHGFENYPVENSELFEIKDAHFSDDWLKFLIVENPSKGEEEMLVYAKNDGGEYKIHWINYTGYKCPPPTTERSWRTLRKRENDNCY